MRHSISYSAPAKVILSGEHAVVYGKPALVSAIDLRLFFSVWNAPKQKKHKTINFIADSVRSYLKKSTIDFNNESYDFTITSNIPKAMGLGSSAALATASVASFLRYFTGREFGADIVNTIAYTVEKHFHENPSGVDNTVSSFGGLVYYRKEFEFLKNISLLSAKIPQNIEQRLFLIDSGRPSEKTKDMVAYVGSRFNKDPKKIESILNIMEKITKRLTIAIIKEDLVLFKKTLEENHRELCSLRVVSKHTKDLIASLTPLGAGKITGAGGQKGGSGFILFYADVPDKLEQILTEKKISYSKFHQSHTGVRHES